MGEFLFWTLVLGGTPLALAFIQQAVARSRDAVRALMIKREDPVRERRAGDSSLFWMHV